MHLVVVVGVVYLFLFCVVFFWFFLSNIFDKASNRNKMLEKQNSHTTLKLYLQLKS